MKSRIFKSAAMLMLAGIFLWLNSCSSTPNTVVVTVSPTTGTAIAATVLTFTSTVTGSTTTTSTWNKCTYVYTPLPTAATPSPTQQGPYNCTSGQTVNGGSIGTWTSTPTESPNVLTYTAPALTNFPNPIPTITFTATATAASNKTGTAVVTLDTGIRASISPTSATAPVGLTPAQTIAFTPYLLNVPPANPSPMWKVEQPVAGDTTDFPPDGAATPAGASCSPSCGSITSSGSVGIFTAPSTMPTNTYPKQTSGSTASTAAETVTVVMWSPSDTVHFATAQITLVNSSTNPITFTGFQPTTVAAGGILQDIFLSANNLVNTTPISFTPPGANQAPQPIDSSNIFTIPITAAYCTASAPGVTPVVTCNASILTRIRLTSAQLATPGTAQITVGGIPNPNNSGQTESISYPLNIVPANPAMVSSVPDSFPEGTAVQFSADGGYFGNGNSSATPGNCSTTGSSGTPLVELLFNGSLNNVCAFGPRQFTGTLQAFQIQNPGLYPLQIVWNANLPPGLEPPSFPTVTSNAAVQPNFTTGSNPLNTIYFSPATTTQPQMQIAWPPSIPLPPMGTNTNLAPSSMAINSNKGYAIITEQASNSVQLVQFVSNGSRYMPAMVGNPVAVGSQPTSVAIDDQINLGQLNAAYAGDDMAVVVNSGDGTLSLLAVSPSGATPITTVNLNGLVPGVNAPPFAVGVDPGTHYAVVAFGNNATIGFVVDVNPVPHSQTCFSSSASQSAPCAIASVSLNTGTTPQVIMQPNAPLAYVTPGGEGVTSVVDLLLANNTVAIAPANATTPSDGGATCPAGLDVATIDTLTANGLNPSSPGAVLISGVQTNSPANSTINFNGTFNVVSGSVSSYSFEIPLTCPTSGATAYGGGGSLTFGNPYYTFSTTATAVGGAINPITGMFAFADPSASTSAPQVGFISALDQTVSSLYLSVGSCNGCTPNPSGAPEVGVRYVAWDPYMDLVIAYNPMNIYDEISLIDPGGTTATGDRVPSRIIQAIQLNSAATGGQGSYTPTGSSTPVAVYGPMAYDPRTNLVLVANSGANTLSYLDIDPESSFKKIHIRDVLVTSGGVANSQPPLATAPNAPSPLPVAVCDPTSPLNVYASCFPQAVTVGQAATLRIQGQGFLSGGAPTVTLDGSSTGITITNATDLEVDVNIAASRFTVAHDFSLEVLSGGISSNSEDLFAVGVLLLTSNCSAADMPEGVAYDEMANVALVTNYGCNTVTFINMDANNIHNYGVPYGTVLATVTVGTNPLGVAVIPRLGYAVVANNADSSASIIQYGGSPFSATELSFTSTNCVTSSGSVATTNLCTGVSPTGVGIDLDRALALVANTGGNSLTAIDLTPLLLSPQGTPATSLIATSGPPNAIAVDPNRGEAVVTNIQNSGTTSVAGGLDVINLNSVPPTKSTTASINTLTANPTGIVYDPAVSPALFYAASTQQNAIYSFDPDTSTASQIRVGVNPYSIGYNYQTGTLVSVNSTSNTTSVIDATNAPTFATRQTMGISSQSQFAVAIDTWTNTAVMADQNNNRVLILPMPK